MTLSGTMEDLPLLPADFRRRIQDTPLLAGLALTTSILRPEEEADMRRMTAAWSDASAVAVSRGRPAPLSVQFEVSPGSETPAR